MKLLYRFRFDLLVLAAGLVIMLFSLLNMYYQASYSSDDVAQKVLLHQSVAAKSLHIFTAVDTYILHVPFNVAVNSLVHDPSANLFITNFLFAFSAFFGFYLFTSYFLRGYFKSARLVKIVFAVVFLYLCTISFRLAGDIWTPELRLDTWNPQTRTLEIGLFFLILVLIDQFIIKSQQISWSWPKTLKLLFLSLLSGLLFYSDPACIFFLLLPMAIVTPLCYRQLRLSRLIQVAFFSIASLLIYYLFGSVGRHFGIVSSGVNDVFVPVSQIWANLRIALSGLLAVQDAQATHTHQGIVLEIVAVLNLMLLVFTLTYASVKVFIKGQFWLIFITLQPFLIFSLYAFSKNTLDIGTARYLILLPFYMALILVCFILIYGRRYAKFFIGIIVSVIALQLLATGMSLTHSYATRPNNYYTETAKVIRQTGIKKGYAPYWNANVNTFYANYTANVFPVICTGSGYVINDWIFNEDVLRIPSSQSFIIVADATHRPSYKIEPASQPSYCSEQLAIKQFGKPAKVLPVTGYTKLLVYNYDILSKLAVH